MHEVIESVAHAISLAKRLKEIAGNVRDAEVKSAFADLLVALAETKLKLADVVSENAELRRIVEEYRAGKPCPKCRKSTWQLESSKPDSVFGQLGGLRRSYRCASCDFHEEYVVSPG